MLVSIFDMLSRQISVDFSYSLSLHSIQLIVSVDFNPFLLWYYFRRYPDGTVKLRNPNIELMDQDILYHLALGSGSHDLVEMFGDVKVRSSSTAPADRTTL